MDPRLVMLTILAWAMAAGSGRLTVLEAGQAILVPCASLGWTVRLGFRAWAVFLTAGLALLSIVAPGRFAEYAAGSLAGWVLGESIRRGRPLQDGFAWAVLPFAAWTVAIAVSGVTPVGEELRASVDRLLVEAGRRGELSVEGLSQLRASAEVALGIAGRTWVGVQIGEFWIGLLLAAALLRRVFRGILPEGGRFGAFDVPDELAWVFAGGLALYLAGESFLPPGVATVGLNGIAVSAVAYVLRGTAIEWHWMERAGVGPVFRVAFLAGGWIFFLPFHALATGSLGLFDTWFDFRRLKRADDREDPFRVFHQSSGDDT